MPGDELHIKNIKTAGQDTSEAEKVLILVHGRGGNAEDMLSLTRHLSLENFSILAPQATNHSWYPYPFLAPPIQNEPWLSSALALLKEIVKYLKAEGFTEENIYFLGFSQGACLITEFASRNATKYGGIAILSGGLIGDKIYTENYKGDFKGTPVFIGSSNPDLHIPVERIYASTNLLKEMRAEVTEKIYPNMGHMIHPNEIDLINQLIFPSEKPGL